jgi:CrcB protein
MLNVVLVMLGGGIGAGLRHLVNMVAVRLFGSGFPAGTLAINVAGSLLMGLVAGYFALRAQGGGDSLRLFLTTGCLGGFTTFSAFSLDTVILWERGQAGPAAVYVLASVALSLAGLVAGLWAVRSLA